MTDSNIADLSSGAGRGIPPASNRVNAVRWRPVAKPKLSVDDKKKFLDHVVNPEEPKVLVLPECSDAELFDRMEDEVLSQPDEDDNDVAGDLKEDVKGDNNPIWDEHLDTYDVSMRMARDVARAHHGKKYPCGCAGQYTHTCAQFSNRPGLGSQTDYKFTVSRPEAKIREIEPTSPIYEPTSPVYEPPESDDEKLIDYEPVGPLSQIEYHEYYILGERCPPYKRRIGSGNDESWVLKTFPLPDTPQWMLATFTSTEMSAVESSDSPCYQCAIKGIARNRSFCYFHCRCCVCEGYASGEYPYAYICSCTEGASFEAPEEPRNNCDKCKTWLRLDRTCPNSKCDNNCGKCGLARWWDCCPNGCYESKVKPGGTKVNKPTNRSKTVCRHFLRGTCRYVDCKFSHNKGVEYEGVMESVTLKPLPTPSSGLLKTISFVPPKSVLPTNTDVEMNFNFGEIAPVVNVPDNKIIPMKKLEVPDDRVNLLIETFENLNFQYVTSKSPGHLNPGYIASFLEWLGFNMKVSVKSEVVRRIGNIGADLRNDFAKSMDCKHEDPLLVVVKLCERIGVEIFKFKLFLPWRSYNKELLVSYEAFTQVIQGPTLNFLSSDAVNFLSAFRSDRVLSTVSVNRFMTDELRHATQMLAFKRIEFVKANLQNINQPTVPLNSDGLSTGTISMRSTRPNLTVREKMWNFLKLTTRVGLAGLCAYLLVMKFVVPVSRSLMAGITLTPHPVSLREWDVISRGVWPKWQNDFVFSRALGSKRILSL